ncbi:MULTISPECIES: AidA/PixA family protein [unclassified Pseudomonas]|uniref:AidA/PixA family protein n=1 Tax=unclassified Pseudomonas TaxID=196821 RepID=UPI00119974A2|nr:MULTISPECIES: AidA/PixA family protein [unclassified Pseudomonas]TWC13413.1 inclusion body protein [Pseudomonas sp. SJZ075]TWC17839.1 inclusion body protein [Pseudomonas sp. SJZ074]TWC29711.1 inclusion body protein [Pseudomonas sp. SJZ078]TWC35757.1 inclusion body protein [Pseudomonas sp. SJZ085]TWC50397.1 inclusion body protein [Pseudomonas sp. SJZ124]
MSSATRTVDVLVTIDADYLLAHNDVAKSVSMLVNRDLIDSHASGDGLNGGDELWFDVNSGDNIRWRATTLSRNFDRIAMITAVQQTSKVGGDYLGSITIDPPATLPGVVPFIDPNAKGGYSSTPVQYTLWPALAVNKGKLSYTITFVLLDQNLKSSQEYSWDPFITVN